MADKAATCVTDAQTGLKFYQMFANDGTEYYLDEDNYTFHNACLNACRATNIPFFSAYGVIIPTNENAPHADNAPPAENVVPNVPNVSNDSSDSILLNPKRQRVQPDETRQEAPDAELLPMPVETMRTVAHYIEEKDKNDSTVNAWEQVLSVIRDGELEQFQSMCEADPALLTRIGTVILGTTPLHAAAAYPKAIQILRWMLTKAEVLKIINMKSLATTKSPLDYAINKFNIPAIEALVAAGCDKNINTEMLPPFIERVQFPDEIVSTILRMIVLLPETKGQWHPHWQHLFDLSRGIHSSDTCVVCMVNKPDTIAIPCGHCVVCSTCSDHLKIDGFNSARCVFCRSAITGVYLIQKDKMQE